MWRTGGFNFRSSSRATRIFFARDPDGFPLEFLEHNEFSRMGLDWPPFAQPGS
jgi:hypothetical protein